VNEGDLTLLGEFMAAGKMTPVIDKRYRMSEASEAFQYVEKAHARGKVVITLEC
jgi:NADPH:quinone reductase-like Zn-dependent oxidoreductase